MTALALSSGGKFGSVLNFECRGPRNLDILVWHLRCWATFFALACYVYRAK